MKKVAIILSFCLALAAFWAVNTYYNRPSGGKVAQMKASQHEFKGVDHDGKSFDLAAHRGKVQVINFWATYCPPCVEEMPTFIKVQKQFAEKVQFVGISVDDNIDEVHGFLKKNNFEMSYPIVMATEEMFEKFGDMPYLPTTVFIGKDGEVVDQFTGDLSEKKLVEIINKLLKA